MSYPAGLFTELKKVELVLGDPVHTHFPLIIHLQNTYR